MEAFGKSLDFISDDAAACSLADALSGNALQKIPEDSVPDYSQRGWRTKRSTAIIAVCVLVGLTIIGFLLGVDVGEQESAPQVVSTYGENGSVDATLVRRKTIFSLVLDWGITSRETLEDPSSHAARALD